MAPSAMRTGLDMCPDLETLSACIDGRLSEREATDVARHLAECETCYFVFSETVQTRAPSNPVHVPAPALIPWRSRLLSSPAAGLAVAATLLLAVAAGWLSFRESYEGELTALVNVVANDRTVEGRLTGGFLH